MHLVARLKRMIRGQKKEIFLLQKQAEQLQQELNVANEMVEMKDSTIEARETEIDELMQSVSGNVRRVLVDGREFDARLVGNRVLPNGTRIFHYESPLTGNYITEASLAEEVRALRRNQNSSKLVAAKIFHKLCPGSPYWLE